MKRRLLILCLIALLLAGAAAFYTTWRVQEPSSPPPAEILAPLSSTKQNEPVKSEVPTAVTGEEEADEDNEANEAPSETVRANLRKADLVKEQKPPDANVSIKKRKAREIVPGVTLEDKELSIQMEKANESLNIGRSKTSEDGQVQMLWKQKF
jgi:hypothetical protein